MRVLKNTITLAIMLTMAVVLTNLVFEGSTSYTTARVGLLTEVLTRE